MCVYADLLLLYFVTKSTSARAYALTSVRPLPSDQNGVRPGTSVHEPVQTVVSSVIHLLPRPDGLVRHGGHTNGALTPSHRDTATRREPHTS